MACLPLRALQGLQGMLPEVSLAALPRALVPRSGWARLLLAAAAAFVGIVLVANHANPCNPRNLGLCGRPLNNALASLDISRSWGRGATASSPASPALNTQILCPALVESLDCYYWFSQRCLPRRHHHFYAKLYVESSGAVSELCYPLKDASLLESHSDCVHTVLSRRAECSERYNEELMLQQLQELELGHGGQAQGQGLPDDATSSTGTITRSVVDSLYDDEALGVYRLPFCRALREFLLCGLQLVRDTCGFSTALRVQHMQDNATDLVFGSKCDASLRPRLPPALPPLPDLSPLPYPLSALPLPVTLLVGLLLSTVLCCVRRCLYISAVIPWPHRAPPAEVPQPKQ